MKGGHSEEVKRSETPRPEEERKHTTAEEESENAAAPEEDLGSSEESPEIGPEDLLALKQQEAKENYEKWLRCQAEFENYKRRQEREVAETCKFANEAIIKELLPTIDNLDRALDHAQNNSSIDSLIEGLQLTRSALLSVLERHGVQAVHAEGEKFDPNFHQAIFQEEDNEREDKTVIREVQKGYLMNDRLIRPSMVVVSKRPPEDAA